MNRIFVMFDILGFRSLLNEHGTKGLFNKFKNGVLPMIQHSAMPISKTIEINGKKVSIPDTSFVRANYSFFSDTIIYYSNDDSFDSFFKIHFTALELLKSGFGMHIPFRGAIGYGDFLSDESGILVGNSIIDAYLGEQSQVWSGCIMTKTYENYCKENGYFEVFNKLLESVYRTNNEGNNEKYKKAQKSLVKYKVPLQKKSRDKEIIYFEEELYVLDWTKDVYEGASEKVFKPAKNKHQEMIINNTKNFENWARNNNLI